MNVDRDAQAFPQASPPTHTQQPPAVRPAYGHQRKDSDTLRSFPQSSSAPSLEQIPQGASPPVREMPPPPQPSTSNQRYAGAQAGVAAARSYRRNPTTSEPVSANGLAGPPGPEEHGAVDGREREAPRSRTPYMDPPPRTASAPTVAQQAPTPVERPAERTPTAPHYQQAQPPTRTLVVSTA